MIRHPGRLILVIVLLATVGCLVYVLTKPDTPPPPTSAKAEKQPLGKLEEFVYTRTVRGDVKWELRAKEALYYAETNELQLFQVEGDMASPARRLSLKGERGKILLDNRSGSLEGSVVGRSDDGYVLYTSSVEFDAASRSIHTDEAVLLEGEHLTLQGVGMDLNLDEQTFVLREQVKATLHPGGSS